MSTTTVRISQSSHEVLKQISKQTGESMAHVLDKALEDYQRKLFFAQLNDGYAQLRADPEACLEHAAEADLWDATLMDGLDPQERWTEDGRCSSLADEAPQAGDAR
jgi:hypothetical protein